MDTEYTPRILAERITHEREMREKAEKYVDDALRMQANEYERRLGALNNAHEFAAAERRDKVDRTLFDARREEVDAHFARIDRWQSEFSGRVVGAAAVFALLTVVVNIALRFVA